MHSVTVVSEPPPEAVEAFKAASAGLYEDPKFVELMASKLIAAFTR